MAKIPQSVTLPSTHSSAAARGGIREAKHALRQRVLRVRDTMSVAARVDASRTIADTLAARADFQTAQAMLLILPFGSEWDATWLIAAALDRNKAVALPRVNPTTRMLDLCALTDLERDVAPGYRGIREPLPHCKPVDPATIAWVLVPGVAFDQAGRRLGYGGGFYDRLLPSLASAAARVAGAFELQIVDRVPAAPHDLMVDAIVTEARTLSPGR